MNKINEVQNVLKTDANTDLDYYGNIVTKGYINRSILIISILIPAILVMFLFSKYVTPLIIIKLETFRTVLIIYSILCIAVLVFTAIAYKKRPSIWKVQADEKKALKKYLAVLNIFEMINYIFIVLTVIYTIMMFLVTPTWVFGDSMHDTLIGGDNSTGQREDNVLIYHFLYTPSRNDIVVMDSFDYVYRSDEDRFFIKRVRALPGDKVKIIDDALYVNDEKLDVIGYLDYLEMFLLEQCTVENGYYIIPKDKYLLVGDNYLYSYDGRRFGLVDYDDILGKAIFRILPFKRFGGIK